MTDEKRKVLEAAYREELSWMSNKGQVEAWLPERLRIYEIGEAAVRAAGLKDY